MGVSLAALMVCRFRAWRIRKEARAKATRDNMGLGEGKVYGHLSH
jgi:hypothetical protein